MNLEVVQQELQSADFVLKTQQQIAKDFGTASVDFPREFRTVPLALNLLTNAISIRLKELESSNSSTFSQLLYRIDIPESILPDLIQSDDYYSSLAEVVIKREAYKVYLRSKFSG